MLWHCLLKEWDTHWGGLVVTRSQKSALLVSQSLCDLLIYSAFDLIGPELNLTGFEVACTAVVAGLGDCKLCSHMTAVLLITRQECSPNLQAGAEIRSSLWLAVSGTPTASGVKPEINFSHSRLSKAF